MNPKEGPLLPEELQEAEHHWIKESQKSLSDRLKKGELKKLSPYKDYSATPRGRLRVKMRNTPSSGWSVCR